MAAFVFLYSPSAHAQLTKLETENLRLIYNEVTGSYLAPHAARCFENSLRFHHNLFGYNPDGKVTVLMLDASDYADAGATSSPRNAISTSIAPFSYAFETTPANERLNLIMSHEMVHVVMNDQAAESDRFFRSIFFGKVRETNQNPMSIFYAYLTTPRRNAPRWYHEGAAVFMETWMAGGYGRAQGSYDEMVFRAKVLDSMRFYGRIGLESEGTKIDFHSGVNSYLYGTRFMSYLALMYGPETVRDWAGRADGSKANFGAQFKKVYGRSLDDIWNEWVEFEHEFQWRNIDSVRQYETTAFRELSYRPLGSMSHAFYDSTTGELYAAVNYPGAVAHIAAIDIESGDIRKICDVKGPAMYYVASLTYDPESKDIFYTTDNHGYRDLVSVNVLTGKKKMLAPNMRVGDLAFCKADKSLWGVRHYNGISTIVQVVPPYDQWDQIYSFPYGKDIYDIDISSDGKKLTGGLAEISGRQTLIGFDVDSLKAGDTTYTTLFDFGHTIPATFTFSADNRYLFGSSYYSGVSNVFRYDFSLDSMDAVSNCVTGFFRPIEYTADSLIAFRFTSEGFLPVAFRYQALEDISPIVYLGTEVAEMHPIVKEWSVGSPSKINLDSMTNYSGGYRAFSHLSLTSAYPIVEGYKHYTAVGMHFDLSGPLMINNFEMTASYTPTELLDEDERLHLRGKFAHSPWEIEATYNGADFYDLFGPTRTSREGYSMAINYERSLLYDPPRKLDFNASVAGYGGLKVLPEYQNVASSFEELLATDLTLSYSNTRSSIGAVDAEKGYKWQLMAGGNYVNRKYYPMTAATFDFGFPTPIPHSSFWFRTAGGWSPGEKDEEFANFYFGGFGNNWVDYRSIKRYREYYTFPGTELNAIGGTNFGKFMFEWTWPPLRFRHLGIPSFYMTYVRPALFSSAIVTDFDEPGLIRRVYNAGAQLDFRFTMMSRLRMTFSIGYALAFEEGFKPLDEWMFSLNIL